MDKKNIEVIVGKKIEGEAPADAKQFQGRAAIPEGGEEEAGGRGYYWGHIICPWCGAVNLCELNTDFYQTFVCFNCGRLFTA